MKAATYINQIRAQVKANHGGDVPPELEGTIRDFANAKELRDVYRETVIKEPTIIDCNLLYQQESLCQGYAKMLGLTAAKAAVKTEDQSRKEAANALDEYFDGIKG